MLAVYGIVGGNEAGWTSGRTLGLLGVSAVLFAAFVGWEARAAAPLVPLRVFKLRNLAVSQVVGILWAAAMFAWFFLAALYLQDVLEYEALEVGLAFVPDQPGDDVLLAAALGPARDEVRDPRRRSSSGSASPASASRCSRSLRWTAFVVHVLPSMILLGIGAGIAFNPVLLAAMGTSSRTSPASLPASSTPRS